jgi:C-terminal domain on Strawberry notch homologue/P-loop containing NTP hydrolase pore-1/Toprim-like/Protein of unknown function (DUF3991)/MutS domain I
MSHPQLVDYFTNYFATGQSFRTISEARKQAAAVLGVEVSPGTSIAKAIDESIEASLVRVARSLVEQSRTTREAYDRLVDLHQRQPILSVRSSTSMLQQAYSTPLPIAYLASTLADIQPGHKVYEPTAGHGALLIAANPSNVTVNELNADRAADLRRQGFTVTGHDATEYLPSQQHDRIICNPPFGTVKQPNGWTKQFELPDNRRGTNQVDQVIALKALETMQDDGRAVLILGGKLGEDAEKRSQRYNSLESRGFFKILYDQYNVTQHFSVWGALYIKQGAGFPIDMIVIEGRGKSQLSLPAARVPEIFKSFDELRELIPDAKLQQLSGDISTGTQGTIEFVDGASVGGNAGIDPAGLSGTVERSHRMDDWAVAEAGDPSPDPAAISGIAVSSEQFPGTTGLDRGTTVGLDIGLGRDVYREQRSADAEVGAGVSRDPANGESRSVGAFGDRPRRDEPDGLAGGTDRRDGNERLVSVEPLEVPYVPRSNGRVAETIIPINMVSAAQKALDKLENSVGDIDQFVTQRLGYDSPEKLWEYFYAEQVDAIALAFHQRDQGNIFLNGDQTGNGKGRFGAANILDAHRQGYIPVFVTQKSNLYNAMLNDLADIGRPGFRVFATDNNLRLNLDDGRRLVTGSVADQSAEMERLMQQGLGQQYQAIFTTYSQLQTIGSAEPLRREFFRAIVDRAVFIFDESHEAGGVSKVGTWKTNAPPNRADFVREMVEASVGSVFMSATSIKNSAVVDLYARRSDARYAVQHISNLETILKDGGVPLQQMVATKFVASGQMVRRGRSMAGITFESKVVSADRQVAEGISAIMRSINDFDEAKKVSIRAIDKQLKAEAKALSQDNAIGQAGLKSTNFTSLMHNAIEQSLLAQKAEATVQDTIAAIGRGEKPIIAVASTMDAFIGWYAKENNIKPGDGISLTFGDVLRRYLERSRDVLIKDYEGLSTRHRLTDDELGEDALAVYQNVVDLIEETDLTGIPLSSIDYIKWRISQEGYRVDEITGRENIVEYTQLGVTEYGLRPQREVSPQGKIDIVNRFNRGDLDVVILNRSGATGISLHASERFVDQKPRHMLVVQVERDVNQVVQMLGRINRFGQVNKPQFTLLMSDLPAEKRLGAILAKKVAELNANVTAARESDLSIANVVDFMNIYGEEVVTEMLDDDIELQVKLGNPLSGSADDSEIAIIKRVTGRIPLLPIQEQEALYNRLESETQDLIAQKEAMGESVLQADRWDLGARTIARMELIPDDSGIESEFTGPVCLEIVDAKVLSKPLTQLQVVNAVREHLSLPVVQDLGEHDVDAVAAIAHQQAQATFATTQQETEAYRVQAIRACKSDTAQDKLNARLDEQLAHLQQVLTETAPGTTVRVVSPEGNIFYGVVSRINAKSQAGSPAAPTNWKAQVLVDHRSRQLTIPLSKFNRGKDETQTSITPLETNWSGENIYESFDIRQSQSQRTELQIFTGNPIKAYERFPKGKFVNYTNDQGEVLQGLVMPVSFDIQEVLREEPVAFHEPHQVKAFLTELTNYRGSVKTLDELLTIKTQAGARFGNSDATGFVLQTPKSSIGHRYFLDPAILKATGQDFHSVSNRMECIVPEERIDAVLQVILKDWKLALATFDFKDQARDFLGMQLPEFQEVAPIVEVAPVVETLQDWQIVDRTNLNPTALTYLAVKDQHPDALLLQRSISSEYYQAFFADAETIAVALDMVIVRKDMGAEKRTAAMLLPARSGPMQRFVGTLEEKGFPVVLDEGIHREVVQPAIVPPQNPGLKATADQVRDLDLESVAEQLGLQQDKHDKHKWRDESHIISINQGKFKDWVNDAGGGGAIDLVMHVQQSDFKTAVAWLAGRSFTPVAAMPMTEPPQAEARPLQLPEPNEENWLDVRNYLTITRGLPEDSVDHLHQQGLIYADKHQNAVFCRHQEQRSGELWTRGDVTGASLRGTQGESFHGLAPGSERDAGYFWLRSGTEEVKRVVLVESAIDAISLAVLEREKSPNAMTVYLSTDGSGALPTEVLQQAIAQGGQVLVAFDADKAGEKMAWRVAAAVPGVKRMVPAVGKDWNDRLLAERHPDRVVPKSPDRQTFKALWKWHRVAAEVGHSAAYLARITEVARDVVDGKGLSEKAVAAMGRDCRKLEEKSLRAAPEIDQATAVRHTDRIRQGAETGM